MSGSIGFYYGRRSPAARGAVNRERAARRYKRLIEKRRADALREGENTPVIKSETTPMNGVEGIMKQFNQGDFQSAMHQAMTLAKRNEISSLTFDAIFKRAALVAFPFAASEADAVAKFMQTALGKEMNLVHLSMPTISEAHQMHKLDSSVCKYVRADDYTTLLRTDEAPPTKDSPLDDDGDGGGNPFFEALKALALKCRDKPECAGMSPEQIVEHLGRHDAAGRQLMSHAVAHDLARNATA